MPLFTKYIRLVLHKIRHNLHCRLAAEAEVASVASLCNCLCPDELHPHGHAHGIVEPAQVGSQFGCTLPGQVFDNAAFRVVHTKLEVFSIAFDDLENPIVGIEFIFADRRSASTLIDPFPAKQLPALPAEKQSER